jgi:MFS family permease
MFMIVVIAIFNIAMAFYRAPVVALMPDLIKSEHRSKANGVINLMGGIGAIYAFGIASQIYKINDPSLGAILGVSAEQSGPVLTFLTTSILMVVALCILVVAIKEPSVPVEDPDRVSEIGIIEAFRQVSFHEDKSALAILSAIFMWFFGYHAMKTWFTTYGNQVWGFLTADASFLLTGMALSFVIFAVPAGFIAGKIGRKNTILFGLVGFIACLVLLALVTEYMIILIILAIAGVFWAMININSIVLVWEMLGQSRLGAGTGLYYGFSMSAAIIGPLVAGFIFDLTSITVMFPFAIIFLVLALVLTSMVKTGEVGDKAIS